MEQTYLKEFRAGLKLLTRKKCWGISAGGGGGSVIILSMGEKIPRKTPIANPHLSDDHRNFDGEMALMISCSWRLDSSDRVICSWVDDYSPGGPVLSGLKQIEQQSVERVEVTLPALDLSLHFRGNLVLRVFCDRTCSEEDPENYVLFTPRWNYTICVKSKIEREPRHMY